jgi:hypothetical protein
LRAQRKRGAVQTGFDEIHARRAFTPKITTAADELPADAPSIGIRLNHSVIEAFNQTQAGTPENDRRLTELPKNIDQSFVLQRRKFVQELIRAKQDRLDRLQRLLLENIVEYIRRNINPLGVVRSDRISNPTSG